MYFNHLFNMDDWDGNATYIVLDDMDFDFIAGRKPLFFAQKEFTMTDKYRHKKTVTFGKPLIYLCNNEPDWDKYPDPYLDNVKVVHVNNTLF